jgi:hypothetical protein
MLGKVYAAYRLTTRAAVDWQNDLLHIQARIAVTRSAFYKLPFLVGANLVFMGMPLTGNPVAEAAWDCAFLALTVILFFTSYWVNQLAIRRQLQPLHGLLQ